jgi:hypothetical protein
MEWARWLLSNEECGEPSSHQYVFKFILCFTRFWMDFTMTKVVNPLVNEKQLLWTSEFANQTHY